MQSSLIERSNKSAGGEEADNVADAEHTTEDDRETTSKKNKLEKLSLVDLLTQTPTCKHLKSSWQTNNSLVTESI